MNLLYMNSNALKHASPCLTPAAWPPPWLAETAVLSPVQPPPPPAPPSADGDIWGEAIDPPPPCRHCGSLELWQDCAEGWHCLYCEPEGHQKSQRLAARARRLRQNQRQGITTRHPSPEGTAGN